MKKVDLNLFFGSAKELIDNNKNEMSKLNYLFGNQNIPEIGMFALFEIDKKLVKLLDKANVKFMEGKKCGDTRESARFNLANSNQSTKEMVKAILKADGNSWGKK
jgi:hypothetical protein